MAIQTDYPRASLRRSLALAEAIDKLGGESSDESAADGIGNKIGGAFRSLVGAGVKFDVSVVSLVGSGYYGRGLGTTFMFNTVATDGNPFGPQTRSSYGYIAQATVKLAPKWSVVGSYGESFIGGTNYDQTLGDGLNPVTGTSYGYSELVKYNAAGVGAIQYQWTKSLRWVGEYTYATSANVAGDKNIQNNVSSGLMLFF